jgi:hypothetical protein
MALTAAIVYIADDLIGLLFFKTGLLSMIWQRGNYIYSLLQNDTRAWDESLKLLLSVLEDDGGLRTSSLASE